MVWVPTSEATVVGLSDATLDPAVSAGGALTRKPARAGARTPARARVAVCVRVCLRN